MANACDKLGLIFRCFAQAHLKLSSTIGILDYAEDEIVTVFNRYSMGGQATPERSAVCAHILFGNHDRVTLATYQVSKVGLCVGL